MLAEILEPIKGLMVETLIRRSFVRKKVIIIILICIFTACFMIVFQRSKPEFQTQVIGTSISNTHKIQIIALDEPKWSFGGQRILIRTDDVDLFETDFENDGANIRNDNFKVKWEGDYAILSLINNDHFTWNYGIDFSSEKIEWEVL